MSNKIDKNWETRIALSQRFGLCLLSDRRYNEAKGPFVEVIEWQRRLRGQDYPSTLASVADLSTTF
jgi:hypothetical protein